MWLSHNFVAFTHFGPLQIPQIFPFLLNWPENLTPNLIFWIVIRHGLVTVIWVIGVSNTSKSLDIFETLLTQMKQFVYLYYDPMPIHLVMSHFCFSIVQLKILGPLQQIGRFNLPRVTKLNRLLPGVSFNHWASYLPWFRNTVSVFMSLFIKIDFSMFD